MAGMVLGLFYALKIVEFQKNKCGLLVTKKNIDEIFIWIVFGIIIGARLGYVVFYNFDFYLNNPLYILSLWEGGMSFHGGAIGVIIAIVSFSKYYKIPILEMGDIICAVVPIGLFFGVSNFGPQSGRKITAFRGSTPARKEKDRSFIRLGLPFVLLFVLLLLLCGVKLSDCLKRFEPVLRALNYL